MHRRGFFSRFLAAGAALPAAAQSQSTNRPVVPYDDHGPLVIERARSGKPRAGQVVVAIQPHADDIPIFAGGTFFKLMDEGATGYMVRVTNDDMAGPGWYAETVSTNERDVNALDKVFGVKKRFDLNYNNHMMDNIARSELRARFIFLFRLVKADIVISYDPWGHYEENPDHYVTAACVEAACWMAGGSKDYPEHFDAGLRPHGVREKYYFSRFQQRVNRVVDTTPWVEKKIDANLENKAQGPAGANGARLRARLDKEGKTLPLLGSNDDTANRNYIREFVLARDREIGKRFGLAYAEQYHYIGPEENSVENYIRRNARPR
ncbi:MAG: PIG-L family deacetylase [Bryobacterales bacterium]|nr:PIG-L family deacetylase [Bryobacterales bacterium]MCZ2148068.1 PIG-L family deacetylase [Bryobacterales bacterium]